MKVLFKESSIPEEKWKKKCVVVIFSKFVTFGEKLTSPLSPV